MYLVSFKSLSWLNSKIPQSAFKFLYSYIVYTVTTYKMEPAQHFLQCLNTPLT